MPTTTRKTTKRPGGIRLSAVATKYIEKYPSATEQELWLLQEYHDDFSGLTALLPFLKMALNGNKNLTAAEKKSRDVPKIGRDNQGNIFRLVNGIAIHDRAHTKRLTKNAILATSALGVLHREAMVVQVSVKGIANDARQIKQAISEKHGWGIAGAGSKRKGARRSGKKEAAGRDDDAEETTDGETEMSIVGRRRKGGVVEYLLRWDDGAQTWESEANGAEALMADYDDQHPWPKPGKKRGAVDSETEDEDVEVDYDVDAVLQRRVKQGEVQYRVRWSDKSLTWEAHENLEGAGELVVEFEDKRKAAGKGPGGRGSFGADKRSGVGVRGAGGADWTSGDAVEGRFEALETGMLSLCETINLMVETQLAQKEQVEEESAVDLTKVPGTRALLKGDKRLRQVGFEHFKKERGLKREKRNSRLPAGMPFSKEYNDVLDQLLDKDAVITECRLKARHATKEKEQQRLGVKAEVLEEEYMALEDELELLQDCLDTAQAGKMQEALQVYWGDRSYSSRHRPAGRPIITGPRLSPS